MEVRAHVHACVEICRGCTRAHMCVWVRVNGTWLYGNTVDSTVLNGFLLSQLPLMTSQQGDQKINYYVISCLNQAPKYAFPQFLTLELDPLPSVGRDGTVQILICPFLQLLYRANSNELLHYTCVRSPDLYYPIE